LKKSSKEDRKPRRNWRQKTCNSKTSVKLTEQTHTISRVKSFEWQSLTTDYIDQGESVFRLRNFNIVGFSTIYLTALHVSVIQPSCCVCKTKVRGVFCLRNFNIVGFLLFILLRYMFRS
jgi:hypothetical protein